MAGGSRAGFVEAMNDTTNHNRVLLALNAGVMLCVAIAWLFYVVAGNRLIESGYRGPWVELMHKILMMDGQKILPLEHYFRGAGELMWSFTLAALALCSASIVMLKSPPRITVAVLTVVFTAIGLSASGIAFFYPLEIETRESTVWLHVLALRDGLNIYDHSRLAFINQNHGPFDPLFKLSIATLLPFLEPWQVARFSVGLLPYAFLFTAWKLTAGLPQRSFWETIYLGTIGYLLLVVSAKEFIFVGRSDATAALLLLPLSYFSVATAPKTAWRCALRGMFWGLLGLAVVLTNWRMLPVVFGLLVFNLWLLLYRDRTALQSAGVYLIGCFGAAAAAFTLILFQWFDQDLALYYKHFFGVYASSSGHGHRPYAHASAAWFFGSLFKPTASPDNLKGGPVLLALLLYLLVRGKHSVQDNAWILLAAFVFAACTVAYYLNYHGGGQWYYVPFLVVLWFYLCANYSAMSPMRLAGVGMVLALHLVLNVNTVIAPSLRRASTFQTARDFQNTLRQVESKNSILSEDTFFFRISYGGELIDMGDMVSRVRKKGYYGDAFNNTVDAHFERIQSQPPDYIVTGLTESPELRLVLQQSYVQVAAGPGNLTANGDRQSRLFRRKDMIATRTGPRAAPEVREIHKTAEAAPYPAGSKGERRQ
jgi:hypothetical protein